MVQQENDSAMSERIININLPELKLGEPLNEEQLVDYYAQLVEQLSEEETTLLLALLHQGIKRGVVSSINFATFTLLAYKKHPKRIKPLIVRMLGKRKALVIFNMINHASTQTPR